MPLEKTDATTGAGSSNRTGDVTRQMTEERQKRPATSPERPSKRRNTQGGESRSVVSPEEAERRHLLALLDIPPDSGPSRRLSEEPSEFGSDSDSRIVLDKTILESENVQNAFAQLGKEIPGTDQWTQRSNDFLDEYTEGLEKKEGAIDSVAHIDSVHDMLKPGGDFYIQRQKELDSQKEILETPAWKSSDVQKEVALLKEVRPETDQWKERSGVVLSTYRDQMIQRGDPAQEENLELAKDMLEPGGHLYSQRQSELHQKELDSQKEILETQAWKNSDVQKVFNPLLERSDVQEVFGLLERGEVEEVVDSLLERSDLQKVFASLKEARPGTKQWKEQSKDVLSRYQDQMIQRGDPKGDSAQKENLELATKMFEPGGYLYSRRQSELSPLDDLLYGESEA